MDSMTRGYYRLAAKNKFLELKRQEFEAWVGDILTKSRAGDYENIRLTQGDGGLDGIILSQAAVVAVNAPRNQTAGSLIKKIEGDFASAKKTLAERKVELEEFIFVHNDEGLTKETGAALMKLRKDHNVEVRSWTFESLWLELEKLSNTQLEAMFGPSPTVANVEQLQLTGIKDVIDHLVNLGVNPSPLDNLEIPDPEKLDYNQLDQAYRDMLRTSRTKHDLVRQYLEGVTAVGAGDAIAEAFRRKYAAQKEAGLEPDDIFLILWNFAGGNHFTKPFEHAAVTAILSYYFHSLSLIHI